MTNLMVSYWMRIRDRQEIYLIVLAYSTRMLPGAGAGAQTCLGEHHDFVANGNVLRNIRNWRSLGLAAQAPAPRAKLKPTVTADIFYVVILALR